MPISDSYIVQYLLQESRRFPDGIVWFEKDSGGYAATLHDISLILHSVSNRAGARLSLTLTSDLERVYIEEPVNLGIFQQKYANADDPCLVQLLRDLAAEAMQQCAQRGSRSAEAASLVRDAIYKRLLGMESWSRTVGTD